VYLYFSRLLREIHFLQYKIIGAPKNLKNGSIRPKTYHPCHQKPNPFRVTVSLNWPDGGKDLTTQITGASQQRRGLSLILCVYYHSLYIYVHEASTHVRSAKKNVFLLVIELLLVTELKKHLYLTRIKRYRLRCIYLTSSCLNSKVFSFQFTFLNMASEVGKNVKK
jgi:hypothetical protein